MQFDPFWTKFYTGSKWWKLSSGHFRTSNELYLTTCDVFVKIRKAKHGRNDLYVFRPRWHLQSRMAPPERALESKNHSLYQIPKRWWHLQSRMAGIIAQLTRAARERSAKRTYGTNKCMWVEETCALYKLHCTLYNLHCTLYNLPVLSESSEE